MEYKKIPEPSSVYNTARIPGFFHFLPAIPSAASVRATASGNVAYEL
jgi:hypothetical protein